ncbi:MAG: two-component sensor histidine kinase [Gammaproteobacteria bacterium]|nr:two-component sensor histidine kinase [Gammaproteobacteria bacterium]
MIPSIRAFLLINLLLSVSLITSLAIIGNLFFEHKNLRNYLDARLSTTSSIISSFVGNKNKAHDLKNIQRNFNKNWSNNHSKCLSNNNQKCGKKAQVFLKKVEFQIWNKQNKLILYSSKRLIAPLYKQGLGFSDLKLNDKSWRLFVGNNKANTLTIAVAEPYTFRDQLESQITQDSIVIMVIIYPFLALMIWIISGRGFISIKKIAEEVHNRAAYYLKPVSTDAVPPEIKPLIKELNSLFIRLHETFQREKRFAADAAHELRTPLAALRAHIQVAIAAETLEEKNEALQKVLQSVSRSTHVVQQLLTLSKMIPSNTAIQERGPVDLRFEAAQIIADLITIASKKNIEIELEAPEKTPTIPGNAISIGILLRNLIDNAIRYTPDNGMVKVIIQPHKKFVVLKVVDNGPGIPEKLRRRVFERFYRIIGNTASGSGLGLGIVKQITKMHKAKISLVTPETGKGLEFRVIFKR